MKHLVIKCRKNAEKMIMAAMVGMSMVSLATIISPTQLHAADEKSPDKIVLAPMVKAPAIDGKIADGEWNDAYKVIGFLDRTTGFSLEPRTGYTLVGYDRENLYIAMSTELPPDGKLISKQKRDDGAVVTDDSIEIWIDPNRGNWADRKGDQRYYQIIINSLGKRQDILFDPEKGVPNTGWDLAGYTFGNRIDLEKKRWELELAIPWKSINADGSQLMGKGIGLFVGRNFKQPWSQASFAIARVYNFAATQEYPEFLLKPNAPVFREESLGEVFDAIFDYKLNIRNREGKDLALKVEASVAGSDMPTKFFNKDVSVPADKAADFAVKTDSGWFHKDADNTLHIKVSANGEVLYQHQLTVKKPREKAWQIIGATEEAAGLSIAYYPHLSKLSVKYDLAAVDGAEKIKEVLVEVIDHGKKAILSETLAVNNKVAEKLLEMPSLADGTYTVSARMKTGNDLSKPLEKTFLRIKFPWERNTLGMTDEVFPPFTPIQTKGAIVETVLRKHTMNGFGLWDSAISMNKELLAAPMTVELETASGKTSWTTKKVTLQKAKPNSAVYQSTAESPAVVLKTTSSIEEDGCMKVEMQINPGKNPEEVKRLTVNIPLKDELAPFWHVLREIRSNPAGKTPQGDGVIWDSTKLGNGPTLGTFLPYIWLGGPERGMVWFADIDKGWSINDDQPAQVLTRKNGQLILSLNLIARPTKIEGPRTIVFGLQATPAKPMMSDWRKISADINAVPGGAGFYWGMLPVYAGKYPAGRDFSISDEMVKTRESGKPNFDFIERWLKEKAANAHKDLEKAYRTSITAGFNRNAGIKDGSVFIYYEEHCVDRTTEEFQVFQDEWGCQQYNIRKWLEAIRTIGDAVGSGVPVHFPKSYVDFSLWYAREWFNRGFSIYSDNTFQRNCYNTIASDAYVREDGQTQPSCGIWEMREYYKRMWKMKNQLQPNVKNRLLKSFHITNGLLVPVIAWGEVDLDIEWEWNAGRDHFPADVILTETTGRQAGNIGVVHYVLIAKREWEKAVAEKKTDPEKYKALARAEWGIRFVHDLVRDRMAPDNIVVKQMSEEKLVRGFGYGDPGCEVINYWSADEVTASQPAIGCSNPEVKWIALWDTKKQELLVVLVNWGREPQQAALTVKPPGKTTFAAWKDAENGGDALPGELNFKPFEMKILKGAINGN